MTTSSPGSTSLLERERTTQRYPQARVIVLDDDVNTFQHVVNCLRRIIPGMSEDKAWDLANRVDSQGAAEVWCGPLRAGRALSPAALWRRSHNGTSGTLLTQAAGLRVALVSLRTSTVRKRLRRLSNT